jgi:heterotetrameric sarcosine oxidase gamma subunit
LPFRQWETARGVKKSILHDRLAAARACFGESAGWERPNWYARPGQTPAYEYSWGRQNWFDNNAVEHRAVREQVGVFEQSSFAKLLIQGRDAEAALNRITTADCRVPVGKVIYTQFLNERGGIEADLSVTRLAPDSFFIVTAAFTATHVKGWLTDHIDANVNCVVTDVSDAWCMLNVQGPSSRELLSSIASGDWTNEGFPFGTAREVQIGYQSAFAVRLTYVGELGWELYIPVPFTFGVYDALIEAGTRYGLKHCGYHTLNSLRIEKAYRDWPHDIGPDDNPLDAGLAFTCAWEKPGGFIGQEALLAARGGLRTRRLVQFLLEDPLPLLYHNEPILRNGTRVGFITSGMYGHTLGGAVGLGYVSDSGGVNEEFIRTGRFEILIGDSRVSTRASLRPFYDPASARPRK